MGRSLSQPPDPRGLSRRRFLVGTASGVASILATVGSGVTLGLGLPRCAAAPPPRKQPRVVLARRPAAIARDGSGRLVASEVRAAVHAALCRLTGHSDPTRVMAALFSPGDVVGIKVNCLAGRGASTHPEVVAALVEALRGAGFPAQNIVVWDRLDRDLRSAGFTPSRSPRAGGGVLEARVLGTNADYEEEPESSGSIGSCFSRILTRKVTAVISVPCLKDHDLAGVSIGLKNFYGAIHNPNRYHDSNCNPYIADLFRHPQVQGKVRLTVCDALLPQCHAGPAYRPAFVFGMGAVLASLDPVALDRVGLRIIEEQRRSRGLPSLRAAGRDPVWIATAGRYRLGEADLARIQEVYT